MTINETYHDLATMKDVIVTKMEQDGTFKAETRTVICEHSIDVYVNEILTMKLTTVPIDLTELVLGRLLTEGIIKGGEDVESIYICEQGLRARVFLKDKEAKIKKEEVHYVEQTPSCCTDNHILNNYFANEPIKPLKPIRWKREWIMKLEEAFESELELHKRTSSTHSACLMIDGKIMFQCEDIGRHNAMDKAIGHAIRHNLDLGNALMFTSGRVPTDMASKVIRAGIPVLVSRKAPTDAAIALAEKWGLTLIANAKNQQMQLYF